VGYLGQFHAEKLAQAAGVELVAVVDADAARAAAIAAKHGCRMATPAPLVGLIMGSKSDWETLTAAAETLTALGVAHEAKVVSAHRTPQRLYEYASSAKARGLKVIIAGAGGAAHLPGMAASMTPLPVLGVPIKSRELKGLDSLLSIVQMPKGVPVGTLAIGEPGAINAALMAAAILALSDETLAARLDAYRQAQTDAVSESPT
jgi:5-(carboxyamino)imidazole ribonucleotide mutase